MLMAEDSSNWNELPAADGFAAGDFDGEDMSIDLDTFYRLLEEEPAVIFLVEKCSLTWFLL
jgi:hypothetical protein